MPMARRARRAPLQTAVCVRQIRARRACSHSSRPALLVSPRAPRAPMRTPRVCVNRATLRAPRVRRRPRFARPALQAVSPPTMRARVIRATLTAARALDQLARRAPTTSFSRTMRALPRAPRAPMPRRGCACPAIWRAARVRRRRYARPAPQAVSPPTMQAPATRATLTAIRAVARPARVVRAISCSPIPRAS